MRKKAKLNLEQLDIRINPTTYTWVGGGSDNFSDYREWTVNGGFTSTCPQNGDTVVIGASKPNIYFDIEWSGTLNAGAATGDIIILNTMGTTLTLSGDSTLGPGTVKVKGDIKINSGKELHLNGTTFVKYGSSTTTGGLIIDGTLVIDETVSNSCPTGFNIKSGGKLTFYDANARLDNYYVTLSVLTIENGGILEFKYNGNYVSSSPYNLDNYGTINKIGSGTATLAVPVWNYGTINIDAGQLNFPTVFSGTPYNLVNAETSTFKLVAGATANFTHGMKSIDNSIITINGGGDATINGNLLFQDTTTIVLSESTYAPTIVKHSGIATFTDYACLNMEIDLNPNNLSNDRWEQSGDDYGIIISGNATLILGFKNTNLASGHPTFTLLSGELVSGTFFEEGETPIYSYDDYTVKFTY